MLSRWRGWVSQLNNSPPWIMNIGSRSPNVGPCRDVCRLCSCPRAQPGKGLLLQLQSSNFTCKGISAHVLKVKYMLDIPTGWPLVTLQDQGPKIWVSRLFLGTLVNMQTNSIQGNAVILRFCQDEQEKNPSLKLYRNYKNLCSCGIWTHSDP